MYKRRFSTPLHPTASKSGTATATTPQQQPSVPSTSQQQTTLPRGPTSTTATASTTTTGKENAAHVEPEAGTAKKPRLFVRPASSAAGTGAGTSAPAFHRPTPAAAPASSDSSAPTRMFSVLYCKRDKFKKKSDKGFQDGIIALKPDHATLLDTAGKVVTKGKPKQMPHKLESGVILELGNFCCEYDQEVQLEDFKRGTCFSELSTVAPPCSSTFSMPSAPAPAAGFKPVSLKKPAGAAAAAAAAGSSGSSGGPARSGAAAAAGGAARTAATGLFDPTVPGAVVVNDIQWQQGKGQLAKGRPVVPVVIDPYLGRHLRPHQREGVSFMYECVMGLKSPEHLGCILADEMGLGKTLQVLTLLWTLLRQGPEGVPVVSKAIVVAPATLVENWGKEVKKWLGQERVRFMKLTNGPSAVEEVNNFKCGTVWKLLIASYEAMRKYGPQLAGSCDLLVCDEGHRLKAKGGNKTIDSLLALNCPKRVVLTGTPVQNNLDEFYALLSFAVPGLLSTFSAFKCVYGDIIARSRDKDASNEDQELGSVRAEELHKRVSAYMLRRAQEVLSKHLPPLAVHTMFCKPSALQVEVYRGLLRTKRITSLLYGVGSGGDSEGMLPAITVLKKLCNHPKLLLQEAAAGTEQPPQTQQQLQQQQASMKTAELAASILQQHLPAAAVPVDAIELSGKLQTLSALLSGIIAEGCKVVVVSTSTTALDMIDNLLCAPNRWRSVRIDGGTSVDERQSIVDNFNTRNVGQVFLLSTRAGGAGLNLIGANHLVLFDPDWNPAADLQAMSRIWRDGQAKPCFVTRLVTAGTIEEKVYQRQMMKSDLADATMQSGAGGGVNRLSHVELKQLFNLDLGPGCSTGKLLESSRAGNNVVWLELQEGGANSGLPPALAAAAAAGAVTVVNRERQQQSTEEAAAAAEPEQPASATAAAAAGEDVEALEVEDDDW